MTVPATRCSRSYSAADPPSPAEPSPAPCNPEIATCTDPSTGAPADYHATASAPRCEPGRAPGAAERQAQIYADSYSRAAGEAPTCNADRVRTILARGRDMVCGGTASEPDARRPTLSVDQLRTYHSSALADADRHALFGILGFHGLTELGTASLEIGAHGAIRAGSRALAFRAIAGMNPMVTLAFAIEGAVSLRHYLRERADFDAGQQTELRALQSDWQVYTQSRSAEQASSIASRAHEIDTGMRFVRDNRLDDPFVQARLERTPLMRLGVLLELGRTSHASQAAVEPTSPGAPNSCRPPLVPLRSATGGQ